MINAQHFRQALGQDDLINDLKKAKLQYDKKYETQMNLKQLINLMTKSYIREDKASIYLKQSQFITICRKAKSIMLSQPSLLKLKNPIIISTGTLGYFDQLSDIFAVCGNPLLFNYLFLGDYVGKGNNSIECLVFLFCLKIKRQHNFFLLRGCYETISVARGYNLYRDVMTRFSVKAWQEVCETLCSMPFAAVVNHKLFCIHGGISPELTSIEQINKFPRPIDIRVNTILEDLLYSSPSFKVVSLKWQYNPCGKGYIFNQQAVNKFIAQNSLSAIVRGHQVPHEGFQYHYNKKFVTICSNANYCDYYNNSASVYILDQENNAYLRLIKQRSFFPMQKNEEQSQKNYFARIAKQKRIQRQKALNQQMQKQIAIMRKNRLQNEQMEKRQATLEQQQRNKDQSQEQEEIYEQSEQNISRQSTPQGYTQKNKQELHQIKQMSSKENQQFDSEIQSQDISQQQQNSQTSNENMKIDFEVISKFNNNEHHSKYSDVDDNQQEQQDYAKL